MPATDPAARTTTPDRAARRAAARSELERLLTAVEAQRGTTTLRELRIDLDRRLAALRRQRAACGAAEERRAPPPAVLATRDEATARRLVAALEAVGVVEVEAVGNGADAVGLAVACQPDVVVVDAPLAMMTVADVVADVRRYVPPAVVVACADGAGPAELRAAGADAVFRRGAAPRDIARELAAALAARRAVPAPR